MLCCLLLTTSMVLGTAVSAAETPWQPLAPWVSWHVGGVAVPPGSGDWRVGVVLISMILCVGLSFPVILIVVAVAAPGGDVRLPGFDWHF